MFPLSVDGPFVTARFRDSENLPFPVLSDFNKDVSRTYGVLEEDSWGLKGVANRSVFVVGRDGRVTYAWVSEDMGVEPRLRSDSSGRLGSSLSLDVEDPGHRHLSRAVGGSETPHALAESEPHPGDSVGG